MKNNQKLIYLSAFLVFALCLSSCNLPIKNAANIQTTTPPPVTITPSPQPTTDSAEATPTPEKPLTIADIVPVTGSVLTWIDFSNFVYVPAGEFEMGEESSTPADFSPVHKVDLAGFWIHQAEVTNQQYASCVEAGVCSVPYKETGYSYWYSDSEKFNDPVVGVTWDQAQQYCEYIEAR
ncbi:MAG: formylglycine-generating enzyme family protein, partial [Anaerolineaceae bacterium]